MEICYICHLAILATRIVNTLIIMQFTTRAKITTWQYNRFSIQNLFYCHLAIFTNFLAGSVNTFYVTNFFISSAEKKNAVRNCSPGIVFSCSPFHSLRGTTSKKLVSGTRFGFINMNRGNMAAPQKFKVFASLILGRFFLTFS